MAKEYECESIAFPLIATGNYGFPKPLALQIAIREISTFLLENEMQIYLVVFGKEVFALSEKLFKSVSSYIDENYIRSKTIDESMTANYYCDEVGTALNYEVISEAITSVRACAAPLSADWKKKIDADYKKRDGKR